MSGWLIETLASTTILLAAVMALRLPLARWFGARTAYALWSLPLARAMLPPLPGWRTLYVPRMVVALPRADTPGRFELALANPALPGPDFVLPVIAPEPAVGLAAWPPLVLAHAALALWLGGAALLLGWQLWRYRRFLARALAGATPIGIAAGTRLLLSDAVPGPVATGIWRRRILLPRDFARRYDRVAQRLVLDHEAAHHDRGDLIANLAAIALLAIHWWNPIAWLAHRAFRLDQELACDASVLARATPDERYRYAAAVARSAGFDTPATMAALSPATQLKRRLRMMGRTQGGAARRAAGVTIIAGVIGASLLASASGSARPAKPAATTMPAPPRPPAPPPPPGALKPRHAPVPPVPPVPPMPYVAETRETPEIPEMPETSEIPEAPETPQTPPPPSIAADRAIAAAAAAGVRAALAERHADFSARRAEAAARRAMAGIDVAGMVRASLAQARAGMAQACAARGHAMSAAARDWEQLATCGRRTVPNEVRGALVAARNELAANRDLGTASRDRAVGELDGEIARLGSSSPAQ